MLRSCLFIVLFVFPILAGANTILLLGDSLSAGYGLQDIKKAWPTLLQLRLSEQYPNYQLVNDSISGETSSNGLSKLPKALAQYHPDIVIIAYGGNDGLRGLDLKAMQANLGEMIGLAEKTKAKVLLAGVRLPPNYGPKYTQAFEQVYVQLAKQYPIALVRNMLENVDDHPELIQADGLHPNEKAQPIVLENIWPQLVMVLQQLNTAEH